MSRGASNPEVDCFIAKLEQELKQKMHTWRDRA
jgi:hypothetical protein